MLLLILIIQVGVLLNFQVEEIIYILMEDLKEGGILSHEEQVSEVHRFVHKCMHDYFEMSIKDYANKVKSIIDRT